MPSCSLQEVIINVSRADLETVGLQGFEEMCWTSWLQLSLWKDLQIELYFISENFTPLSPWTIIKELQSKPVKKIVIGLSMIPVGLCSVLIYF